MSDLDQRGLTPALSTIMLIALTVVFVAVIAAYVMSFLPGAQNVAVEPSVLSWAEYPGENKIQVRFEHLEGQTIELGDLIVAMSGTDSVGIPRNYRSDSLSTGMTNVSTVIYHLPGTPDLTRTVFEFGDILEVTFTLENDDYLFDVGKYAIVSLIYTPANQILITGRELTSGPRVVVSITPKSQIGTRGETLNYTVAVKNNQSAPDTFTLTASNDRGWSTSLPGAVSVGGAGASEYVTLQVTIPSNASSSSVTTVTAVSQSDPDVFASDNCVTRVRVVQTINPADEGGAWAEEPTGSITNPALDPPNDLYGKYFWNQWGQDLGLPGPDLWLSEVGFSSPPGMYQRQIFLKFSLPDLGTEMSVEGVKFRFYFGAFWINEEPDDTYVYACSDSWSGTTLTWNNRPSYGSQLSTVGELGTPPAWIEWQSSGFATWVDGQYDGDKIASLFVKGSSQATWDGAETMWMSGGVYRPGWGNKPELVVTYLSNP